MSARDLVGSLRRRVHALVSMRPLVLRGCDVVGPDIQLHGRPSIKNQGRMEIGRETVIWSRPVSVQLATSSDGALFVGERVTIGYGTSIVAEGLVTIGEGTRIGPFGTVFDTEDDALSGWGRTSRPVVIGRDVRIGSKVTVLPGTSIGDGAEIAAGSVVSGLIPANSVAAGAPARVARSAGEVSEPDVSNVSQRVALLLARVFDRPVPPPLSLELERLSGWGGNGALRLLLALEEEFGTNIPPDEWLTVRSPADLIALVQRRTRAGAEQPAPTGPSKTEAS